MGGWAGGELLDRLEVEVALQDEVARFYAACVVAALDSLHSQDYVYRVHARPAPPPQQTPAVLEQRSPLSADRQGVS